MDLTEPKRKTYVALYAPNGQFSQSKHFEVDHRDPYKVPTTPEIFAVQFYDIIEVELEDNGKFYTLQTKEVDPSPLTFIRGKVMHRTEIEEQYPDSVNTIQNMERFNTTRAVKFGSIFLPFIDSDRNIFLKDYVHRTDNGTKPE